MWQRFLIYTYSSPKLLYESSALALTRGLSNLSISSEIIIIIFIRENFFITLYVISFYFSDTKNLTWLENSYIFPN